MSKYTTALTPDGDENVIQDNFLSVLNHIMDIHEGHGDSYHRCHHGPQTGEEVKVDFGVCMYLAETIHPRDTLRLKFMGAEADPKNTSRNEEPFRMHISKTTLPQTKNINNYSYLLFIL